MTEIWYVYPTHHTVSFTFIAKAHIALLKRKYTVQEVPERSFVNLKPYTRPIVFIHPLFYATLNRYAQYLEVRGRYKACIGVEVADSDRISPKAAHLANTTDAMIVPSQWARRAFLRSGVNVPVYVVPHGLRPIFRGARLPPTNPLLKKALELKRRRKLIYIAFFVWHSPYRKGYDLVIKVMREIQKTHPNAYLLVWEGAFHGRLSQIARTLKGHFVLGWVSTRTLVEILDMSDIYLLFSRGGGFECAGLEALARGCIVLAPDKGAWTEYLPQESLVKTARMVPVFSNNPVHVGFGAELSPVHAVNKLHEILDNLPEWKAKYSRYAREVREKWAWPKMAPKLYTVVEQLQQRG